jgi:thiamine pyrophosphate-dependent acetolactate synthase large subunit-like protein
MRWNSSGHSAAGRCAVVLGQADHGVLHDVERGVVVAHRMQAVRLKARRSTERRKASSSVSTDKGRRLGNLTKGRRGPLHLRRALQAGQGPAHSGAPRAGRGACRRRLFARATEKVGVALVTSGPGVTNAVTGIATAYMDSIPMVDHHRPGADAAIGKDAFQECDTVGITRPCVKHNFLVKDVKDIAETMKKAFHIASTGRPGPVLVDIPKDVTLATSASSSIRSRSRCARTTRWSRGIRADQEGRAAAAQRQAPDDLHRRRRGAGERLGRGADASWSTARLPGHQHADGPGRYPATDPQFVGMPGMHGTYEANMAMQHCDVLIAVGARFDDRVIGNPKHFAQNPRKIIHVDIDPSSISKRVKVDVPIVGDVQGRAGRPDLR